MPRKLNILYTQFDAPTLSSIAAKSQEAVCDLLWSLAFNNGLVKEVVGRQGGIALILKGMSSHLSSPELIKSACGALSNMCQNTYNQNLIAAHGGVRYDRVVSREARGQRLDVILVHCQRCR